MATIEQRLIGSEAFSVSAAGSGPFAAGGDLSAGKGAHAHPEGQLAVIADGLLVLDVGGESWMMSAGRIGWIPPGMVHSAVAFGLTAGWNAYIDAELSKRLPPSPAVLKMTDLTAALFERVSRWESERAGVERQRRTRVIEVLLDELESAEHENLHLPVPSDRRLRRLAATLAVDPASNESLERCADRIGMSGRTMTRQFKAETNMTIGQWRNMARMKAAVEMLAREDSVTGIAFALGFDSASSFIARFRETFGTTPARYRRRPTAA